MKRKEEKTRGRAVQPYSVDTEMDEQPDTQPHYSWKSHSTIFVAKASLEMLICVIW